MVNMVNMVFSRGGKMLFSLTGQNTMLTMQPCCQRTQTDGHPATHKKQIN
jgi:hypothetical protein